jgi:hypothetical protein
MMGDLSGGFGGLELDHAAMDAVQPKQKTPAEQLDEQLGITAVNPFAVEKASRPSMRDRISARRSTRGSDNPINPVMDWLSGTDWSQGREAGKRPVLANVGPKLLHAAGFVNPQIAGLNRLVGLVKSFKEGPKEASLGILGSLIGNRFGAQGQNIFNTARDIRSNKSTFKQGIGKLLMGKLLSGMGKNRDVGEGIMSMVSGKQGPKQALLKMLLGRGGRAIDPRLRPIYGAGIETLVEGKPGREAFGSALKNMAGSAGKKYMFQRAFQKGGMPAVRKLRAAMSLGGGPP